MRLHQPQMGFSECGCLDRFATSHVKSCPLTPSSCDRIPPGGGTNQGPVVGAPNPNKRSVCCKVGPDRRARDGRSFRHNGGNLLRILHCSWHVVWIFSFLVLFIFTGGLQKTKCLATIPRVEMDSILRTPSCALPIFLERGYLDPQTTSTKKNVNPPHNFEAITYFYVYVEGLGWHHF